MRAKLLQETYNQVTDEDLHDLRLQALASLEDLLQEADEDVAKRCANDGAIQGHLGHARGEVMSALAPVVCNPRCEKLLETGQSARCKHLSPQWVAL